MTPGPVFIGGCDRSGTTMLGDILGSAAGAFVSPESQFVHELIVLFHQRAFADPGQAADWLANHFRFAVWGIDLAPAQLEQCINLNDATETVRRLLAAYRLQHGLPGQVWVDHTPDNARCHAVIKRCFPDARFIHLVRDGRAVFQSVRSLDWGPNNAYSASRFWSERVEQGLQMEIAEGDNCRRVRFEDIAQDPAAVIEDLCRWLGLDYGESMLSGGALRLPSFTRGQHQLVGRRPESARIDQWRRRLSPGQVRTFEAYARSRIHLAAFGYASLTPLRAAIPLASSIFYSLHNGIWYGVNRMRHRQLERRTVRGYRQVPHP